MKCVAYAVFIASAADCDQEWKAAYQCVLEWNARHTLTLRRAMIPRRWNRQMIPMAGADPQELINEELLAGSDLLVAIFKNRFGDGGTQREVRYFIENGRARRVMLFVSANDGEREPALREFIAEMRTIAVYQPFATTDELVQHLEAALLRRAELSLAVRPVADLRAALTLRIQAWGTFGHNLESAERAFDLLVLTRTNLITFSERDSGRNLGNVDPPVELLSGRLEVLVRDQDAFFQRPPWAEATSVMEELASLLRSLPEEWQLL